MVKKQREREFGTPLAQPREEERASNGKHSHDRKWVGGLGLFQALLLLGHGNDDA
jgi:hypothetical protein